MADILDQKEIDALIAGALDDIPKPGIAEPISDPPVQGNHSRPNKVLRAPVKANTRIQWPYISPIVKRRYVILDPETDDMEIHAGQVVVRTISHYTNARLPTGSRRIPADTQPELTTEHRVMKLLQANVPIREILRRL